MIHNIQLDFHDRITQGRSLDKKINTYRFEELYSKSTIEEKKELQDILLHMNRERLNVWMAEHSSITIDDWTKPQLQAKAQAMGIPYATRLLKDDLTKKVKEAIKNEED